MTQRDVLLQVLDALDALLDTVGGDVLERSWQVVRRGGILASIAGMVTEERAQAHALSETRHGRGHFVLHVAD
ncbi:MAG: hypothetical protein ACYC5O_03015 [Anaerolineae bacterium]